MHYKVQRNLRTKLCLTLIFFKNFFYKFSFVFRVIDSYLLEQTDVRKLLKELGNPFIYFFIFLPIYFKLP